MRPLSGLHRTLPRTAPPCPVSSRSALHVAADHTHTLPASSPDANRVPDGLQFTAHTVVVCCAPLSSRTTRPSAALTTRMPPSAHPARISPSAPPQSTL
jgi:hypothetical protein